MNKLEKIARKLAAGDISELLFRLRGELTERSERSHHRNGNDHFHPSIRSNLFTTEFKDQYALPTGEIDFVSAVRNKSFNHCFAGLANQSRFSDFLGEQGVERIIGAADNICENRFPIFSLGCVSYGDPPRWNYDPVSGKHSPDSFYADIEFLNPNVVGDSKVTWEIARFQFVYDLGQAYILTNDEKYARKFFDLIIAWSKANPDYQGIGYCSALEFAFRAHSIAWAFAFFRDSPSLDSGSCESIYRVLNLGGIFLANHLSAYFSPNTHLLGEAYGLYLLGALFPEFVRSREWKTIGRDILIKEIDRQFTVDGMHAEGSTAYHAYAVEFVLSALLLGERSDDRFPESCYARFDRMLDVHSNLQQPNGTWPHIGDEDGGRLYSLSRTTPHDFNPILEAGLAFRERLLEPIRFAESFWLLGEEQIRPALEAPKATKLYESSGLLVMRDKRTYGVMQFGPFGYFDCPHSHADHLHLDLAIDGKSILVDPGTFVYTGDLAKRNLYRGCTAHNGPAVEGLEFYDRHDAFAWEQKPDCVTLACHRGHSSLFHHAGYSLVDMNGNRVSLERRVLYVYDYGWLIRDDIHSPAPVRASWNFVTPGEFEHSEKSVEIVIDSRCFRLHLWCDMPLDMQIAPFPISNDYFSTVPGNNLSIVSSPASRICLAWGIFLDEMDTDQNVTRSVLVGNSTTELRVIDCDGEFGLVRIKNREIMDAFIVDVSYIRTTEREIARFEKKAGLLEIRNGSLLTPSGREKQEK